MNVKKLTNPPYKILYDVLGQWKLWHLFFGKHTKGILNPDVIRQKGKISILAYWELCEKSYGFDNYKHPYINFNDQSKKTNDLSIYDTEKHKVRFSFNYFQEKLKSNDFEYLRVYLFQPIKNKWRVIVEE